MIEPVFESIDTLTQAEFAEWVSRRSLHDTNRYELLNRRIVANPSPGYPHGSTVSRVGIVVGSFARAGSLGECMGSSQGFELPSGDTVEPDFTFVSNERWRAMPAPEVGKFLRVVPDLVVEILSRSTSSRDRGEKKAIYERNGVREYWIVDPHRGDITLFAHDGSSFDGGRRFGSTESFHSKVLEGLEVRVGDCLVS
jgi:Uma2 family endonuclease